MVVRDVDSSISFSPDGRRMAYIRGNDPEAGKYRLLSANLDGTDRKVLVHCAADHSGALAGVVARWQENRLSAVSTGKCARRN